MTFLYALSSVLGMGLHNTELGSNFTVEPFFSFSLEVLFSSLSIGKHSTVPSPNL